jgi:putative copper resistance protein D
MAGNLLLLARAFHLGSGMILAGLVAFRWLVLRPAWRRAPAATWAEFAPLLRQGPVALLVLGMVLLISGVAWFWAVAAGLSLTGSLDPSTLGLVLTQTQFGRISEVRLGLFVLWLVALGVPGGSPRFARARLSLVEMATGLLTAALFLSIAWTGHAAATNSLGRIVADALHLLAAAIWPGGLVPFALFLWAAGHGAQGRSVLPVIARFSAVSLVVVGCLVLTGLINSWFLVGSISALWTTDYGRLLSLKLGLLALMLALAAWNRWRVLPLLFTRGEEADAADRPLLRSLRRYVTIEAVLGLAIVAVVSVLGTTPPPR